MLIFLSEGYSPVIGRLHTRYAPVRHSSACIATPVTVRLACIRPAASVNPEPGSNSPLYVCLFSLLISCSHEQEEVWYSLRFSIFSVCIMKDETEGLLFPNIFKERGQLTN